MTTDDERGVVVTSVIRRRPTVAVVRASAVTLGAVLLGGGAALGGATSGHAAPPVAHADPPQAEAVSTAVRYQVTLAARVCDGYADVPGGRIRDDRVEAAALPGRDAGYQPGQSVDPSTETRTGGGCRPLPGWRFTFGSGRQRQAVFSPATGVVLSSVTGVVGDSGQTAIEAPRLDAAGHPVASTAGAGSAGSASGAGSVVGAGRPVETLAGAVTVTLGEELVGLAMRRSLWVQGGRPEDPLLGRADLAFGALRCGTDTRSASATAWLGYPAGARHAYCYAYYVKGAPPAGTIVVRARLTRPVGHPQRLGFASSFGYAPDRSFSLATAGNAGSARFPRPAGGGYRVAARLPDGWRLDDLDCATTRQAGVPTSATRPNTATAEVEITLAAAETVTCTFTVRPPEPGPGLTVRVSADAAATFGLALSGTGRSWTLAATTAGDGGAATATGADLSGLDPGTYTLVVTPPAVPGGGPSPGGGWRLASVTCSGAEQRPGGLAVTVPVAGSRPVECALVMSRSSRLVLRAATVGGAGPVAFAVEPARGGATDEDGGAGWAAVAKDTTGEQPAEASGDVPANLPPGEYLVTPLAPRVGAEGGWLPVGFDCGARGAAQASAPAVPVALPVTLPAGADGATCTARYRRVPATRLQVALHAEGAAIARGQPAVVEVRCVDGAYGRVVLASDEDGQSLPTALSFLEPTRCTVTHPETGVTARGNVTTVATLAPASGNAPLTLPATVEIRREAPDGRGAANGTNVVNSPDAVNATEYTVTVTDTFGAIVGSPRRPPVRIPVSLLPVVLIGSGLIGIGALVLLITVLRWRRSPARIV